MAKGDEGTGSGCVQFRGGSRVLERVPLFISTAKPHPLCLKLMETLQGKKIKIIIECWVNLSH